MEHFGQPSPHPELARRGPHHAGHITACQPREPVPGRSLRGPETVVGARRELPRDGSHAGQATLEDATPARTAARPPLLQPAPQYLGPERRDGHPLTVDRVEREDGVPHGHEPLGEPREAVVVPPAVLGRALAGDGESNGSAPAIAS